MIHFNRNTLTIITYLILLVLIFMNLPSSDSRIEILKFTKNLKDRGHHDHDHNRIDDFVSATVVSPNTNEYNFSKIRKNLLNQISNTNYLNYIDLYRSPNFFQNLQILKSNRHLDQTINDSYLKIIEKMFHFEANAPDDTNQSSTYKRLPNIIGIGSKKCGTTALKYYLGLHPNFKAPSKEHELHFFDSDRTMGGRSGPKDYLTRLAETNNSLDVIYEKTPRYMINPGVPNRIIKFFENKNLANQKKYFQEKVKFICIVCNPVKRAASDFIFDITHQTAFKDILKSDKFNGGDFNEFFRQVAPEVKKCIENQENCPNKKLNFNSTAKLINSAEAHGLPGSWHILTNGFYSILLKEWLEKFPRNTENSNKDKIILVDGDQMITNLPNILINLEQKFGLPKFFEREKFKINEENGFYCYYPNGVDDESSRKCLSDESRKAGQTRGSNAKVRITSENEKFLSELYEPYNRELERMFGVKFDW